MESTYKGFSRGIHLEFIESIGNYIITPSDYADVNITTKGGVASSKVGLIVEGTSPEYDAIVESIKSLEFVISATPSTGPFLGGTLHDLRNKRDAIVISEYRKLMRAFNKYSKRSTLTFHVSCGDVKVNLIFNANKTVDFSFNAFDAEISGNFDPTEYQIYVDVTGRLYFETPSDFVYINQMLGWIADHCMSLYQDEKI